MIALARKREDSTISSGSSIFEIEHLQDKAIVTALGRFNLLPDEEFSLQVNRLLEATGPGVKTVVIDLHKTHTCSSDRLVGPLILLWNKVRREKDGSLVVCGLNRYGREVLKRTKLDRLWTICPTRDEALETVGILA